MDLAVDGRTVFAATGGRPFAAGAPAAVFVHGAGMDHTVWALQTRWFAHHGRSVLAVDLPGHGRSAGPALESIGAMADWLLRLLEAAGAGPALLVGHSMGALVCLEAAAQGGARVARLALLGVTPAMPVHPDLQTAADGEDHRSLELMTGWAVGRAAQIGGQVAPGLWTTGAALRLLESRAFPVLGRDLAACNAYGDALAAAARVACPALLLLGADDRMTPARKAAPLADALAGSRTVVLPAAGHMMMIEQPNETLDALIAFAGRG